MAEGARKQIVWPPVVVVENAGLGKDPETGQFTGLERREVESAVNSMVDAMVIRRTLVLYTHAGHTGRLFVLFPSTDAGYADAAALHDAFERRGRGRRHLKLGQKDETGKLVLYGYLATEGDMNKLDRHKRLVKRWTVEDYDKVILEPRKKKMKESHGNRCLVSNLDKDVEQTQAFIEQEKAELEQIREELKKQKELEEAEHRRQEEAKARHTEKMREVQDRFEAQRAERLKAHQEKIEELKARKLQDHLAELTKASQEKLMLEGNIDRQKEENEKIRVEIQALEKAMSLEEVLANMKSAHAKRMAEVKSRQAKELFELKQRYADKKKQVNEEALAKAGELDDQLKAAEEEECAICFGSFADEEGRALKRALYAACGHIGVCYDCATKLWEKDNKQCPICQTEQEVKPPEYRKVFF